MDETRDTPPDRDVSPDRWHRLDITGDLCPMTFVKTKLALEKAASGEIVDIRLKAGEPLENVPRSVTEDGHHILSLEAEETASDIYRLRIRRR